MWQADLDIQDERRHAQRYYGKYPGRVLNNAPPEGSAHRGELLVEVSGMLEEGPDGADRPMQVVAKPSFLPGFFFIPEEGATVWIEFVAGDINSPIWTGVWYPNNASPDTAGGTKPTQHQKIIRTKSGHVIQLDDSEGSEKIVLSDEAHGNKITLDASGIKLEAQNGGSQIVLDATGVKITDANGVLQFVVLEPLIRWLRDHQHTGNMGTPTPLIPILRLDLEEPGVGNKKSGR